MSCRSRRLFLLWCWIIDRKRTVSSAMREASSSMQLAPAVALPILAGYASPPLQLAMSRFHSVQCWQRKKTCSFPLRVSPLWRRGGHEWTGECSVVWKVITDALWSPVAACAVRSVRISSPSFDCFSKRSFRLTRKNEWANGKERDKRVQVIKQLTYQLFIRRRTKA